MIKRITLSALLAFSSISLAQAQDGNLVDFGETESLTITSAEGQHVFNVEIADTDEKQVQGLMFRKSLADDAGMLFEFAEPKVATIWMKNTEISLDILFIRKNGSIVKIEHSAQPQTLRSASSEAIVAAVLELPAGKTQELGVTAGDIVSHSFFETN